MSLLSSEASRTRPAIKAGLRLRVEVETAYETASRAKVGFLQRLFSMFPNGWPGAGLLILRLVGGTLLSYNAIAGLMGPPHREPAALLLFAAGSGLFVLIGLWTPVAGTLVTIVELSILFSGTDQTQSAILLTALGLSIAMLGPGVWSIDALLFGRQRLDVGER